MLKIQRNADRAVLAHQLSERFERIDLEHAGQIEEFDDINAPFSHFDPRYGRLRSLKPQCKVVLRDTGGLARGNQ